MTRISGGVFQGLTLLVGDGADVFNLAVQLGHELRVAADAGEVGDGAVRGGYGGLCCGRLGWEHTALVVVGALLFWRRVVGVRYLLRNWGVLTGLHARRGLRR